MDGIQAARKILESLSIPIIFVTGYKEREIVSQAESIHPTAILSKPTQPGQLYSAIDKALLR